MNIEHPTSNENKERTGTDNDFLLSIGGEDVVAYIEYDIGDSSRITELLIALDISIFHPIFCR
jgi:hypothetical protein